MKTITDRQRFIDSFGIYLARSHNQAGLQRLLEAAPTKEYKDMVRAALVMKRQDDRLAKAVRLSEARHD